MDRRAFLGALGLVGVPLAVHAQSTARPVKIGVLCAGFCPFGGPEGSYRPFIDALAGVGLIPGCTLAWDIGGVINAENEIAVEAQKLVARRPDLILVWRAMSPPLKPQRPRPTRSPSCSWPCPTRSSTD